MRFALLFLLLAAPAVADEKVDLGDRTMGLTFENKTIKKCRHGHKTTPVVVMFDWLEPPVGHHIEQIEVCPICYKKLLQKEAGY